MYALLGDVEDGLSIDATAAVACYERCVSSEQQDCDAVLARVGFSRRHRATSLFNLGMIYQVSAFRPAHFLHSCCVGLSHGQLCRYVDLGPVVHASAFCTYVMTVAHDLHRHT